MFIKEILDQPIFLNPHTKLDFSFDNFYFYCVSPSNISDKSTIMRDLTLLDSKPIFQCLVRSDEDKK